MSNLTVIEEENLSIAWAKAFLCVTESGEISPLIVNVEGIGDGGPAEENSIRQLLDNTLANADPRLSCETVANTIFPSSLWNPQTDRCHLFERYYAILPRLRRRRPNVYGTYFGRLIAYGYDGDPHTGTNQLEHVIDTWQRGNHRRSALQASVFDPEHDHTHQRQRGFPCMQQVAFAPDGDNGLSVTGFFATQYMFQRAYGNYLGLCRLGHFMASEMGLNLSRMTCVASIAKRSNSSRKSLSGLERDLRRSLVSLT